MLWDDTFVRYHEPHIGRAAVAVLEAAALKWYCRRGRKCLRRPAFSQGNLRAVVRLGRHNLALLEADAERLPVLFLEPSCWSMFVEDYRELQLPGAENVAPRCHLFEHFIEDLLSREPAALSFRREPTPVAIHAHCHAKARLNPAFLESWRDVCRAAPPRCWTPVAAAWPELSGRWPRNTNCRGRLAQRLADQIGAQPPGAVIVASGTSCRQQIEHLTPARPKHMAELLAESLEHGGQE